MVSFWTGSLSKSVKTCDERTQEPIKFDGLLADYICNTDKSNLYNRDTEGTERGVRIREVTMITSL